MSRLPKTNCCLSTPRCARCPVRLALEVQARETLAPRAALVDEVFRGTPAQLPPPVAEALAGLALARAEARPGPANSIV
ncbi:MAG: hypothetical protein WD844_12750 [Thermoleophilaceae bacterium]